MQDHDGHPIEGFVRVFRGDSPFVSRKVTGSFLLQLPPGHYRIEVHAESYQPVQIKLDLHENQGAAHQFVMNKIWHAEGKPPPEPAVPAAPAPAVTSSTAAADSELSLEEQLYAGDSDRD
jgi:hypothetical protein